MVAWQYIVSLGTISNRGVAVQLDMSWLIACVVPGDLVLATVLLSLVVMNISGLAFFMISIMGWTIGIAPASWRYELLLLN